MKATILPTNTAVAKALTDQTPALLRPIGNPLIEIVVPVLNEEKILEKSIHKLDRFLSDNLPYRYRITIADNGSTDGTQLIARRLALGLQTVRVVRLKQRGRGRALKQVWQESAADVLAYMDVDLSTDLDAFLPMIKPLISGEAGVAIGSRLHKDSQTTRGFKREFISRCYNQIIKFTSKTRFSDAQCGFKAIRRDVAKTLLPRIKDNEWFFDTELLIKAENLQIGIHEQPVKWVEDTDSRVHIIKTAIDDLKGLYRVKAEIEERSLAERLAIPLLLIAAALLYTFGALHNNMANSYYSAAVQAASTDWTAWLFGSLDAANYVSVDKPPISTMIMGLSARIFGFSSLSMLLPSILAGVGSVWLLYSAVKRQFGWRSAIIAGTVLAFTPVAALMFGFNNPDALLTFFLTASAYAFLRSLEQSKPLLWLGLAALFTGIAFNTKMLQGLMVLPAMVIVYVAFAKPPFVTRLLHMAYAGIITAVSTFWWSVLVWLTPASNRPWVGSTNDNNIWSLIFGYNGFGRLLGGRMGGGGGQGAPRMSGTGAGSEATMANGASMAPPFGGGMPAGGGGHGPGGSGFGGQTGILRMFNTDFGPNIAWFLLAALLGSGVMLWILRKTPRDNRGRAAVIFWLMWLLVHIVIFSMTSGTIHPYYVVVMAPAVAALVGISLPFLWTAYKRRKIYGLLLPVIAVLTSVTAVVMLSYSGVFSWLGWVVLVLGLLGAMALIIDFIRPKGADDQKNWLLISGVSASLLGATIAPLIFTLSTVNVSHTGSIPTAGPNSTAMAGSNNEKAAASSSLTKYLLENQDGAKWIVAVASANESAAIQISTGQPVMAVGGFNGSDTPLTLDQFKQLIKEGKIKYYAVSSNGMGRAGGGDGMRGGGGPGSNNEISQWVQANAKKVNYGGSDVTLYQLDS